MPRPSKYHLPTALGPRDTYRQIGFIGNPQGLTEVQAIEVERILNSITFRRVNHPDFIGGCYQMHLVLRRLFPTVSIGVYTCPSDEDNPAIRGHAPADYYTESTTYEARIRRLCFESQALIAAPGEENYSRSKKRQWVWDFVVYASQIHRPIWVITPAGVTHAEYKISVAPSADLKRPVRQKAYAG